MSATVTRAVPREALRPRNLSDLGKPKRLEGQVSFFGPINVGVGPTNIIDLIQDIGTGETSDPMTQWFGVHDHLFGGIEPGERQFVFLTFPTGTCINSVVSLFRDYEIHVPRTALFFLPFASQRCILRGLKAINIRPLQMEEAEFPVGAPGISPFVSCDDNYRRIVGHIPAPRISDLIREPNIAVAGVVQPDRSWLNM